MPAAVLQVVPVEETRTSSNAVPVALQGQDIDNEAGPLCLSLCLASLHRIGGLPLRLEQQWYDSIRGDNSHTRIQLFCLALVVALVIVLPLLAAGTTSFREAKDICNEVIPVR